MQDDNGRGSNLTDEDRAEGGRNSHKGGQQDQDETYGHDVSNRGFAGMPEGKVKDIASKGGQSRAGEDSDEMDSEDGS